MLYFLYILKIRTKRGEKMNQTALLNGDVIAVNSKNEVFETCLIEEILKDEIVYSNEN